jgi:hypothetical protein
MTTKGDDAIALLKKMEWSGMHTDYEDSWGVMTYACPCCMNARKDGHKPGCALYLCIT